MITKALTGDFMGSRKLLHETMVLQGTSGEDMVSQIYQEVSRRVIEGKMDPDFYIDIIEAIANCDFTQRSVRKFDLDGKIFCIFSYYGVINVALRARNAEDSVPYRRKHKHHFMLPIFLIVQSRRRIFKGNVVVHILRGNS